MSLFRSSVLVSCGSNAWRTPKLGRHERWGTAEQLDETLQVCAVAVSSTSSLAPLKLRSRRRSSLRMRFMCANRISTFLRSRDDRWNASVLASARTRSRTSSLASRVTLRIAAVVQRRARGEACEIARSPPRWIGLVLSNDFGRSARRVIADVQAPGRRLNAAPSSTEGPGRRWQALAAPLHRLPWPPSPPIQSAEVLVPSVGVSRDRPVWQIVDGVRVFNECSRGSFTPIGTTLGGPLMRA
jgi:hypothetical protein